MHKPVLLSALLASTLLVPSLAAADEPDALGKQGTFVIGSDVKGVFTRFSTDTTSGPLEATTTITTVELEPAIDYFVVDKVSLGLRLLYNYETSKTESDDFPQLELESSETTLGVGLRVGVHHRLASRVSLWARLGAAYNTTDEDDDGDESTVSGFLFDAQAIFLLDIVPHLFVGAGPGVVYATLEGDNDVEASGIGFGLGLEVGGWF